jgi:2-polyprenyl-3-methyl-5-hydroxy-6-metoxy-1,4-benzoquinol methylase
VSSKESLHRYHDTKYAGDAVAPLDRVVECQSSPANRFEACLKYFPSRFRGGDILELGAGSGLVARSLIANGLEFDTYTLSELSSNRLEGLLQKIKDPRIRVVELDAESIGEVESPKYDAIIMLALIAQLVDPLGAMRRIRQLVKPGGFVFIETPNVAKLSRRVKLAVGHVPALASRREGLSTYEGGPVLLLDEGHLHYFTFRSLSLMLIERCGFSRVEKLSYFVGRNGRRILGHKLGDRLGRLGLSYFRRSLSLHMPEGFVGGSEGKQT